MTTTRGSLPPQGPRNPRGRREGGLVPAPLPSSSYDGLSRVCHAGTPDNRATAEEEGCSCEELQRGLLAALRAITALIENLGHLNRCPRHSVGVATSPTRRGGAGLNGEAPVPPQTYAEAAGGELGNGGGNSAPAQPFIHPSRRPSGGAAPVAGGIVPPRCYRCLTRGHERWTCPSTVDRSNCCLHCGEDGHQARGCNRRVHCPACAVVGHPAAHRIGGRGCPEVPPLPVKRKRRKKRKKKRRTAAGGRIPPDSPSVEPHGVQMDVEVSEVRSEADTVLLSPRSIDEEGGEQSAPLPIISEVEMEVEAEAYSPPPNRTSPKEGESSVSPSLHKRKGGAIAPSPTEERVEGATPVPPSKEKGENSSPNEGKIGGADSPPNEGKEGASAPLPMRDGQGKGDSSLPSNETGGETTLPPTDEAGEASPLHTSEEDSDTSSVTSIDPLTGEETKYVMIFIARWRAKRRKKKSGPIEDGPAYSEAVDHIQRAIMPLWMWPYIVGRYRDPSSRSFQLWFEGPRYKAAIVGWKRGMRVLAQKFPLWGLRCDYEYPRNPEETERFELLNPSDLE